ncbi:hypothetical protein SAMN05421820_103670 [Pedobacter steynii]|uniref:Uncharacterized protein n=1 Tax=Pedobacter steynii TaxID=430522 RepID=A0A1G9SPX2_9SPHI|nr:hypothetical protein SAMN05421820_103670 [Pedobacter steynii]
MFLDCMYIICCDFYRKREPDMFKISGLILLIVVFMLNFMLVSFLGSGFKWTDNDIYQYRAHISVGCFVLFGFILYIRYFKVTSYDEVNNKFYKLNSTVRNRYLIGAWCYIILSILSAVGYIVYHRGTVNGWW